MKTVLAKNRERLDQCGIRMPILGVVTVLGWADNLLFMSRSLAAEQLALDIFTQGLHEMGMRWKASSMQYLHEGVVCTTYAGAKRNADVSMEEEEPQPLPEGHRDGAAGATTDRLFWCDPDGKRHQVDPIIQMELLGCLITTDNKAAIQHRLVKASAALWKRKAFFLSSVVSRRQKMIEYVKKVRPVALYGSASWQWGADTSTALSSWEGAMLMRMCRVGWRQAEGESFRDWRRRHTKVARQQLHEVGADDIASAMLRRQFRWIKGNLHRFSCDLLGQTRRVQRLQEKSWHHILASIRDDTFPRACRARSSTACAVTVSLTINDAEGWKLQQGIMPQLDPRNRCGWRHSKPHRTMGQCDADVHRTPMEGGDLGNDRRGHHGRRLHRGGTTHGRPQRGHDNDNHSTDNDRRGRRRPR